MPADGHVGRGPGAGLAVVLSFAVYLIPFVLHHAIPVWGEGLLAEVMYTRSEIAFLREHFADSEPPARRLTGEPVRVAVGLRVRACPRPGPVPDHHTETRREPC